MFPLPFSVNYVYIAAAVVVAIMVGTIKYQHGTIVDLEVQQQIWQDKNKELVAKLEQQNKELKDSEVKFNKTQRDLDLATGKNQALTKEYTNLRDSWKVAPVPKDCPTAIAELKVRTSSIATKWNSK